MVPYGLVPERDPPRSGGDDAPRGTVADDRGTFMSLFQTFSQLKPHLSFRLCAFRGWG